VETRILELFPWIDVVVRGEAEATLPLLLGALPDGERLAQVPGIFYRLPDGSIRQTAEARRITNLDRLPLPAYHRLDMAAYDAFGIVSSRGCPYGCRFCSVAPSGIERPRTAATTASSRRSGCSTRRTG